MRSRNLFRFTARRGGKTEELAWDAGKSALIICDIWDSHRCESAARRTAELAPRIDAFARFIRDAGGLIVHAPSGTMKFYSGTKARRRALLAPWYPRLSRIKARQRDPSREPELPIDDSDGGCDDNPSNPPIRMPPSSSQHPSIEIFDRDAISQKGREIFRVFAWRGIRTVFFAGVHTNRCVLERSFGIRQLVLLGFNVVLMRDLTDSLYNPAMPPFVDHDRGTELVVAHIEQYWCASAASTAVSSL